MTGINRQHGMTMIETMVAMAISSVLVLGSITIYNNARSTYRTAENLARLQESLRFATDTLDQDARLAGFWGRTNSGAGVLTNPLVVVECDAIDVSAWAIGPAAIGIGIEGNDDNYNLICPGTNPRANSDVLVVRHAATNQNTIPTPDQVQVLSHGAGGQLFSNGILPIAPPLDPDTHQVYDVNVNAYYVSNVSKYSNTLPSLRRRALVGTTMQDQEIITGVENLQVQYGIDRNDDGQVDGYVDFDHPGRTNDNVVAVRLWLLVRGDTDETGQGYQDDDIYQTPDADGFVINPDAGDVYPQNFRRFAFTKTIMLKN